MTKDTKKKAKPKGLAAMSPERRKEIARMGGKASAAAGKSPRFNSETGTAAGAKAWSKRRAKGDDDGDS